MRRYPRAQGMRTLCGDLNGGEVQKGGDICVRTADSFCSIVETNNMVKQLYISKNERKDTLIQIH